MKRPRDSQRSKLFQAENCLPLVNHLPTVPAIQSYVNKILHSRWWKNRFTVTTIKVEDGRGRRTAAAWHTHFAGIIAMPRWSRYELVILHELAHIATPENCASHGREFARNFVDLVTRRMGNDTAKALKASFDKGKVKWRKKRQLSDAERARLSAQIKRIRKAAQYAN